MRKYELYTHIHSYVHIFTHTNTDADNSCADIHACFYTYGYGCTHTKPSIHSSIHVKLEVKVKLKFSLNQATKFRMGVSSTLSLTSALDGVGDRRHAPAALPPGNTRYSLYRRLVGPQARSERVRKISPPSIRVHKHTHTHK